MSLSMVPGMPMTLIEAMGSALPIVTTPVGGIPDLLDKESAIFVDGSAEDICRAFEMYYKNKNLREEHGKKAKEKSNGFSNIAMAKKYIELYK